MFFKERITPVTSNTAQGTSCMKHWKEGERTRFNPACEKNKFDLSYIFYMFVCKFVVFVGIFYTNPSGSAGGFIRVRFRGINKKKHNHL